MDPSVEVRIGELLELRSSKLRPNHPLQPQTFQPLNMIAPDDHVEQTSTNQSEDNTVLNNLSSHLSGELPSVIVNLKKASEVAFAEVASESPQQHAPEPQKTPSNPEQATTTVLEQTSPEQSVPQHSVPEQTGSDHISSRPPSENVVEYDGMVTSEESDTEMDQSSATEIVKSSSNQPSTSYSQSIRSNIQPTDNLQIEPIDAPRPTKLPSQPTRFLDSMLLQGVCEDIAEQMIKLIAS